MNYNGTYYTYLPTKTKYKSKLKPFLTEKIKSVFVIFDFKYVTYLFNV